jgi:hypothetical protein
VIWSVAGATCLWLGVLTLTQARPVAAVPLPQAPTLAKDQLDFFESRIRPIFTANC